MTNDVCGWDVIHGLLADDDTPAVAVTVSGYGDIGVDVNMSTSFWVLGPSEGCCGTSNFTSICFVGSANFAPALELTVGSGSGLAVGLGVGGIQRRQDTLDPVRGEEVCRVRSGDGGMAVCGRGKETCSQVEVVSGVVIRSAKQQLRRAGIHRTYSTKGRFAEAEADRPTMLMLR